MFILRLRRRHEFVSSLYETRTDIIVAVSSRTDLHDFFVGDVTSFSALDVVDIKKVIIKKTRSSLLALKMVETKGEN